MIQHIIAYIVLICFLLLVFYIVGNDIEYCGFWNRIVNGIKNTAIIMGCLIAFACVIILLCWAAATVMGIPL